MVGNKGKVSRSKSKALKPRPAESESEPKPAPSQISPKTPNGLVDVVSDGEYGRDDISNETEIPLEEKMLPGSSAVNDVLENDQKSVEDDDLENHDSTAIKAEVFEDVRTGEGTIADVKEVSDGGHTITNLIVEDNEQRINAGNPEEDEAPLTGDEIKVTTEDMSPNGEPLASDNEVRNTITDNVENDKEPNKLEADKPVGTPSDKEEENMKENANVTGEVKVVTTKVNGPKRKLIKRKLVKKKLVRRNAVAQTSDGNNASGGVDADKHVTIEQKTSDVNNKLEEACKADSNVHVSNEKEAEVKPSVMINKKRNRIKKKNAPQSNSGTGTIEDTQKPQSQNGELGSEKHITINEADVKNDEVENSKDKASPLKRNKNKKIAKKGSQEGVSKDVKKPKEGKSSKKVESMGMIFMCSSETKKDCFRYNILGLPAGKKDMVLKIYKGMRLFLFDVDLKMMYGIFKAAGPGGYNLEPRAFKSQFPSQVRFTVLEDCVPLAEERFRKVLKDNYYSKKKFNTKLNNEQVKNLCKLFHEASKKAESTKQASRPQRAAPTSSTTRRDKRKRIDDNHRSVVERPPPSKRERRHRRPHEETRREEARREETRREEARREEIRREGIRHAPVVISDRYHERPAYVRETYVPPVAPMHIYQPFPRSPPRTTAYSYDYNRVLGVDSYRRETVIDSRDLASSRELRELRLPIEQSRYDSYLSYREPPRVYSGQAYSSGTSREHYDYGTSDRRYAAESENYRTADHRPAAPPLPLYRRY